MAYDEARQRTVLFGGHVGADETWEWDGTNWTQLKPTVSPSGKIYHAMAYDSKRGRTVLFGGTAGGDETWEWDGKNWYLMRPAISPPARAYHVMCYDSVRQRSVMYGGNHTDTWEWDGKAWVRTLAAAPQGPKNRAVMAFDWGRRRTVLAMGEPNSGGSYEYDGFSWTISTRPTDINSGSAMVYDSARQRLVMFAGLTLGRWSSRNNVTHERIGTTWRYYFYPAPSGRERHAMAYDSHRRCIVMFGGMGPADIYQPKQRLGDTWEFIGAGSPIGRFSTYGSSCGPSLQAGTRPRIGGSFTVSVSNLPSGTSAALMCAGVSNRFFQSVPLPMSLDFMGMKGCFLHTSFDAAWAFPVTSGSGQVTLSIPSSTVLLGQHVYFQAAAGMVASNGGDAFIGT
jgi:hypothetical protein